MADYNTRLGYNDDDLQHIEIVARELEKAGYSVYHGGKASVTKVLLTLARLEAQRIQQGFYPPEKGGEVG